MLSEIPIIGPVLFDQTIIVYLMYVAVALVWFGLFRTRWGLRLRSVGEHPQAADTVGINVNRTRFWNVALAGAIAGLGGAYFTLGSVGAVRQGHDGGAGYIALAAVIFGRWDPIRATLAALLFGFAENLQNVLSIARSPVPNEFLLMLPYVVTDLRRRRIGRPGARARGSRQAVHQVMSMTAPSLTDVDWDALRALAAEAHDRTPTCPTRSSRSGLAAIVDDGRIISGCQRRERLATG